MIVQHDAQRSNDIFKVRHWLTHAHHDYIGNHAFVFRRNAHCFICPPQLPNDFGSGQITVETLAAGRTEGAFQCAADLRGNTQRTAFCFGDKHRFHAVARSYIQQPFARPIGGFLRHHQFGHIHACLFVEFQAQGFCQIGHFIETLRTGLVDPAHDLFGAERFFAHLGKMMGQSV